MARHPVKTVVGALVLGSATAFVACSGGATPSPSPESNIGTQVANVASDTEVMKEAQGAANELVRNAQDCDVVKAAIPNVTQKLDEAGTRVRTATGQATLAAIKARVSAIIQACP